MIAQEMAVAAAGLGSIGEQQSWTQGYWEAVCMLLPSHQARQHMDQAHVALIPNLWRHAHAQYEEIWARWRETADAWLGGDAPDGERQYPAGVVVNMKGLMAWFSKLFGGQVRSE